MPGLRFIADMNVSPMTVSQLKLRGLDIVRVSEIMDCRAGDIDILEHAKKNDQVVITFDLDFSELLAVYGYERPSVINLRLADLKPGFVAQRIVDVTYELEEELKRGVVVSVVDGSARYRNLPIE